MSGCDAIRDWLVAEAWQIGDTRALFGEWVGRLVATGLPLQRMTVVVSTLHPEVIGHRYHWQRGEGVVEGAGDRSFFDPGVFDATPYKLVIDEGIPCIRRRIERADEFRDFAILEELREEGATDYVVHQLDFGMTQGDVGWWMRGRSGGAIASWATARKGGFRTAELVGISSTLDPLARLLESHSLRRIAQALLETYVGKRAGARILRGEIVRGTGESLDAVIWMSDLRDSTPLSENLPRDTYIGLLNAWFDALGRPIAECGGEIVKFLGDGLLAIFPSDRSGGRKAAVHAALEAAAAAERALEALNEKRVAAGEAPLRYGIALHAGEVSFGNVGATGRLDFTVIGPAVNLAHRLERLCRTLGRTLLVSAELAPYLGGRAEPLGSHAAQGFPEPLAAFGVRA